MNNDKIIDILLNNNHDNKVNENKNINIQEIRNIYDKELSNYEFIEDIEYFISNCKNGGYIRYVDMNNKLKWGGILLKIKEDNKKNIKNNIILVLKNKNNKIYEINWRTNYIFYKKHKTSNDNLRDLFISLIT